MRTEIRPDMAASQHWRLDYRRIKDELLRGRPFNPNASIEGMCLAATLRSASVQIPVESAARLAECSPLYLQLLVDGVLGDDEIDRATVVRAALAFAIELEEVPVLPAWRSAGVTRLQQESRAELFVRRVESEAGTSHPPEGIAGAAVRRLKDEWLAACEFPQAFLNALQMLPPAQPAPQRDQSTSSGPYAFRAYQIPGDTGGAEFRVELAIYGPQQIAVEVHDATFAPVARMGIALRNVGKVIAETETDDAGQAVLEFSSDVRLSSDSAELLLQATPSVRAVSGEVQATTAGDPSVAPVLIRLLVDAIDRFVRNQPVAGAAAADTSHEAEMMLSTAMPGVTATLEVAPVLAVRVHANEPAQWRYRMASDERQGPWQRDVGSDLLITLEDLHYERFPRGWLEIERDE